MKRMMRIFGTVLFLAAGALAVDEAEILSRAEQLSRAKDSAAALELLDEGIRRGVLRDFGTHLRDPGNMKRAIEKLLAEK